MSLRLLKQCTKCGKTQPRKWSEDADFVCLECKQKAMIKTAANRKQDPKAAQMATALRSDPTRRALRNQGDDLDPLNPLSLTSPLNPIYHTSNRADWDHSSHRSHSSTCDDDSSRHSSHSWSGDSGSSYDSGSSDSGSSSSGGCD